MKRGLCIFTILVLLALPLAMATAQGPPPPPERLPPGAHVGRSPEARPWALPGTAETARPTSLIWHIETVDSTGNVGYDTSLALDASDNPHISYFDITHRDLKYTHFDGTCLGQAQGWQIETVDSSGEVGWYTSLALDANDHPHISYYDWTNEDLKYAHFDGTSWLTETVDSAGSVGGSTSLALDASDHPHISYFDYDNFDLKYAHLDSSGLGQAQGWQIETVDGRACLVNVGLYTSLALDASGRPHISYHDLDNGALKYAWGEEASYHIYLPLVLRNY